MFRFSTIIRELALNLAKLTFMLKRSVKLRRYLLCGCVAACCHTNGRTDGWVDGWMDGWMYDCGVSY